MMLGPEGQRRFKNKLPHEDVEEDTIDCGDLWHMLDVVFHKKRNMNVARVAPFSRRQEDGDALEQFHGVLQSLAAKCKLRDMEEKLVGDLLITSMTNLELQKKFFVEEMDAETVLKTALAWESGLENQRSLAKIVKPGRVVSGTKAESADLKEILDERAPAIKA